MPARTYLFTVTHWLLRAGAILMLLVVAALTLAEGALFVALFNLDGHHMEIPAAMDGITRATVLETAIPVIGVLMVCVAMLAMVLHLAAKILESARTGDPFVNENADRLMNIGWLLLALEVIGVVIHLWLEQMPYKLKGNIHLGFDFSPVGLLGILLIFVLAQVFRRGSEMRAELEGMV